MTDKNAAMAEDWARAYKVYEDQNLALSYPSETLVRLFKGDYVTGRREDMVGKRVLDMGFGNGNNTLFLAMLGMRVAGVEIHQEMCDSLRRKLNALQFDANLQVGGNRAIPFADDSFDYLVSWNVIHYEGSEENVRAALQEYRRVLKPGGRLILSTTGPAHKILKNGKTLGGHRYEIGRPEDFRQGQVHFFFDAPNYIEFYFSPYFHELQVGRIEDQLFRERLDWWLVTGVK